MVTEAGNKFWLCKIMSGTKKLVHAPRKLHTATTAIPGAASGMSTYQRDLSGEAPSMYAASSISYGTVSRKFFISQVQNGNVLATKKRIHPCKVSVRLRVTYMA